MRKIKAVYFNDIKESELIQFAHSVNFSEWVKVKIKEELSPTLPERTEQAILLLIEQRLKMYSLAEKSGVKDDELVDDLKNFF